MTLNQEKRARIRLVRIAAETERKRAMNEIYDRFHIDKGIVIENYRKAISECLRMEIEPR